MEVIKKLRPGSRGTKRYMDKFGAKLYCVRYRYDEARQKRVTTVEVIVDDSLSHSVAKELSEKKQTNKNHTKISFTESKNRVNSNRQVFVRVRHHEVDMRRRIRKAGGRWLPDKKLWQLPYQTAATLGLKSRIVGNF